MRKAHRVSRRGCIPQRSRGAIRCDANRDRNLKEAIQPKRCGVTRLYGREAETGEGIRTKIYFSLFTTRFMEPQKIVAVWKVS